MESFFLRTRTQVKGLDAFGVSAFTCVLLRKKKSLRSNKGQFFCLKCTVSYTYIGSPCLLPVFSSFDGLYSICAYSIQLCILQKVK